MIPGGGQFFCVFLFCFSQILQAAGMPGNTCPLVGAAVAADLLTNDPQYAKIVDQYFLVLTPGNEMKWGSLEPQRGQISFKDADVVNDWVNKHNKLLRIHTLFAQSQYPDWVTQLNQPDLANAMLGILQKVIQRYSARAIGIDVCNEIIDDDGNLRQTPWMKTLGPGFVEMVYSKAREFADQYNKNLMIYINDYGIETKNKKSDAMLQLATSLYQKKILNAVGFQCHFIVGQIPNDFKENMERFTNAGLLVAVTEIDIRIQTQGRSQDQIMKDRHQQVQDYMTVFNICKEVRGCVSFTVWGVTFKDSWIGSTPQFQGFGEAVLFTPDYQPTMAMTQLLEAGFASGMNPNSQNK